MNTISGHCLCRAVAFSYEGAPNWTLHCHCESCRRATSSPMATWISVPRNAFTRTSACRMKSYETTRRNAQPIRRGPRK